MTRNIIHDGYTRTAQITPAPGLHDGLICTYRPMTPDKADLFIDDAEFKRRVPDVARRYALQAKAVAEQLVDWSEADEQGNAIAISGDAVRRLPWALFHRLFSVVAGLAPGDLPPNSAPSEQQGDYLDSLEQSLTTGVSPGVARAEADAKN